MGLAHWLRVAVEPQDWDEMYGEDGNLQTTGGETDDQFSQVAPSGAPKPPADLPKLGEEATKKAKKSDALAHARRNCQAAPHLGRRRQVPGREGEVLHPECQPGHRPAAAWQRLLPATGDEPLWTVCDVRVG